MPYTKTTWVDGSAPAISASNLNKIETGIYDALRQDGTTAMSGQLVVTSGSATTPSIAASGDANTGLFFPAADTIAFVEGGTEAMRINSSGNVGIGTTSPNYSAYGASTRVITSLGTIGSVLELASSETPADGKFLGAIQFANVGGTIGSSGACAITGFQQGTHPNSPGGKLDFYTRSDGGSQTERMTITSAGNVGIGTSSPSNYSGRATVGINGTDGGILELMVSGTQKFQIYPESSSITDTIILNASGASGVMRFQIASTEQMRLNNNGYLLIGYTSSNGAYPLQVNGQIFATSATIATSDKNYKENIKPLTDALSIVNALNPVSFDWKEHPVHNFDRTQPTIGFIAQEVAEVLKDKPYLDSIVKKSVCEWETETGETVEREVTREVTREIIEEVDDEEVKRTITEEITEVVTEAIKEKHTEEFYGIAESNLIAILTKAVQELSAEVKALKAQIK